jgi:hypothetical protein
MALLQVRNCPDTLYEELAQVAAMDRRSIAQESVVLLDEALRNRVKARRARREAALKMLIGDEDARMTLDPVTLIREDRDR